MQAGFGGEETANKQPSIQICNTTAYAHATACHLVVISVSCHDGSSSACTVVTHVATAINASSRDAQRDILAAATDAWNMEKMNRARMALVETNKCDLPRYV